MYRHQAPPWLKPFVSSKYLHVSVQITMALPGHPQTYLPIYHTFSILCLVIYLDNHSIAAGQAFRIQSCCCHCGCCNFEDICFGLKYYISFTWKGIGQSTDAMLKPTSTEIFVFIYLRLEFHFNQCFHYSLRMPSKQESQTISALLWAIINMR